MRFSRPWLITAVFLAAAGSGALLGHLGHLAPDPPIEPASPGRILRLDARLDHLLAPDTRLERVASGFNWLEGPVWQAAGQSLFFTDIPANSIYRWTVREGTSLFLRPSGYSGSQPFTGREPGANGLALDHLGRLVLTEHGDRRITRLGTEGTRTVLADRYEGRRLNSPNDLVFRSNGDLYFTDPPFGLPGTFDDPARELDFCGVYRLTPDGRLDLLIRDIGAPNGLAFSPDEKTLYVTDVHPARPAWLAYDVLPDGRMDRQRLFFDPAPWMKKRPGGADGLKADVAGNLFAAGPGGVYVFTPDGSLLGVIETGVATSNVAWGGDGSVLFITAGGSLYRIRTLTRGANFPSLSAP